MKQHTILLLCLFVCFEANSQSKINEVFFYNGAARANTIAQLEDSTYVLGGTDKLVDNLIALKIDRNSNIIWDFKYDLGNGGGDVIYSSILDQSSNLILGGFTADISVMNSDAYLIKMTSNKDTIWVKKYGLANRSERCYHIKQTSDGGYIFCGLRFNVNASNNITDSDVYLVKTDSLGTQQWEKTYGGSDYDWGNSIEVTEENGFMILGQTYSYGPGLYNMYLIKTDSLGNLIWQKTYSENIKDYGTSICKTIDGDYLLAGGSYYSTDTVAAKIIRIDSAGNEQWQKKYPSAFELSEFTSVRQLETGEIVALGHIQEKEANLLYYGRLMKLDSSNGTIIWERKYKYFHEDSTQHYFYGMDLTYDGGFAMCGMTVDYRAGANPTNSMWLVKTDSLGCDISNCVINASSEIKEEEQFIFNVYPNPSSGITNISYSIPDGYNNNSLIIFNQVGQIIKAFQLPNNSVLIEFDTNELSNGIYSCQLNLNGITLLVKKLVVLR